LASIVPMASNHGELHLIVGGPHNQSGRRWVMTKGTKIAGVHKSVYEVGESIMVSFMQYIAMQYCRNER